VQQITNRKQRHCSPKMSRPKRQQGQRQAHVAAVVEHDHGHQAARLCAGYAGQAPGHQAAAQNQQRAAHEQLAVIVQFELARGQRGVHQHGGQHVQHDAVERCEVWLCLASIKKANTHDEKHRDDDLGNAEDQIHGIAGKEAKDSRSTRKDCRK
jgi:hypothetical protein